MSLFFWLLLSGAGLFCVTALSVSYARSARITQRLRKISRGGVYGEAPLRLTPRSLLSAAASPFIRAAGRRDLATRLAGAGFYEPWHTDAYILASALLVGTAFIAGIFVFEVDFRRIVANPMPFFKYLATLAVCGRLPGWWLRDRTTRHREKIRAAVPQAVDFMTICVESGLSLEDAFDKVGAEMRRSAPEVASEMRLTRSEMLMLDRTRALQRLKTRSGVREMETLADALLQSIRFGTPIVDTLQSIATESRAGQISALEERAGSISAKVGLPLILLILFPLVVLLSAPPIVQFFRTL